MAWRINSACDWNVRSQAASSAPFRDSGILKFSWIIGVSFPAFSAAGSAVRRAPVLCQPSNRASSEGGYPRRPRGSALAPLGLLCRRGFYTTLCKGAVRAAWPIEAALCSSLSCCVSLSVLLSGLPLPLPLVRGRGRGSPGIPGELGLGRNCADSLSQEWEVF